MRRMRTLGVAYESEGLAADLGVVAPKPLMAEVLADALRRVRPKNDDFVRAVPAVLPDVARDLQEDGFLRVEDATRRVHQVRELFVVDPDGPSDAVIALVDDLNKQRLATDTGLSSV